MPVSFSHRYLLRMEEMMKDLRLLCLGMNVRLDDIMPPHLSALPVDGKAKQLTQQLLFSMTQVAQCTNDQLSSAGSWFYDIFYYLLLYRPVEEQTLYWFLRLYNLDPKTRNYILIHTCAPNSPTISDKERPVSIGDLEKGLHNLVLAQGRAEQMCEIHALLSAIRKQSLPFIRD